MIDPRSYRLGVTVMDFEHGKLLEMINGLTDPTAELAPLIDGFKTYAERHFLVEESLMEAHDYREREEHLAAHAQYRQHFEGLAAEALTGSPVLRRAMHVWLERWWVEHIGSVDRKLATFLREMGMHDPE